MRTLPASLVMIAAPLFADAQTLPMEVAVHSAPVEYQLGGATSSTGPAPTTAAALPARDTDFRFPVRTPSSALTNVDHSGTAIGDLLIFGSDGVEDGRDVVRLGTALVRGRTTTGVSFSYDEDDRPTRSEVFVDYAVTESFSLGVSGIVSDIGSGSDEPVTRLGLSAAYATGGGSFVQGGIANAPDTSTVIGLSLGLRF